MLKWRQTARRAHSAVTRRIVFAVALATGAGVFVGALGPQDGTLRPQVAATSLAQEAKAEARSDAASERAPSAMTAEEIAERVQDFYKKTKDFHSPFRQTYTDIAAGETKRSQGTVYFKKPGMMRWDYTGKKGERQKVLVSDGSNFWVYEPAYQQVFKECLKDSQLPTSLRFLMGEGDLLKDFDVELTGKSTAEAPELKLTPKKATSHYKELRFLLDAKTFHVKRTTIFDPYGNTNQIEFSDIKINKNLPDSGFQFKPPKDVRFLNPQKKCE